MENWARMFAAMGRFYGWDYYQVRNLPCVVFWWYLKEIENIRAGESMRRVSELVAGDPAVEWRARKRIIAELQETSAIPEPRPTRTPAETYAEQKRAMAQISAMMGGNIISGS